MAKRPVITKSGATKAKRLPAEKKRKLLVAEIHKEEQGISAKALEPYGNSDTSTNIQFETGFESYSYKNSNVSSVGLVKCIEVVIQYLSSY